MVCRPARIFAALLWSVSIGAAAPVCGGCHPQQTVRYLASPMGNSLGPPASVPAGSTNHAPSGGTITVEFAGAKMLHRLREHGLTADYPIAWQIGAGLLAHTYIVDVNGFLFESPATWFRASGWDLSPGYAAAPAIDFDRPITRACLFCHAGTTEFADPDGRRPASASLTAITCERCHGPAAEHARQPSAKNIRNPAKLPPRARDSVCEQCHLEGVARTLNPGKTWQDFHPGDNLENVLATYVWNQNGHQARAVSQVEQLAESRCSAASAGRLWCGTCHHPHSPAADRPREIRQVCLSCHPMLSETAHRGSPSECVSCHMPQVSTDYAHVAVTDHRILRPPSNSSETPVGPKTLAAWKNPPPEFRARDLALAELTASVNHRLPALAASGLARFAQIPAAARMEDVPLLAAACEALMRAGEVADAVALCGQAARKQPESAERAMYLGIAFARQGDLAAAARELDRAIRLDPSLKHAYVELWTLCDKQGKSHEARQIAVRYLRWNPRNIMFRFLRAGTSPE